MDNDHPEVITVELGGKERRLKLGPSAFRRAELRGSTIRLQDLENPGIADLTHLVWVGLLPDNPTLEEEKVLTWLDKSEDESAVIASVAEALRQMVEALSRAMAGEDSGGK